MDLIIPFTEKSRNNLYFFWFFSFLLLKGLRWDVGSDWPQFLACFERCSWENIFSYYRYGAGTQIMEPGYVFLNVLVKTVFPFYNAFLLITNAFIMYAYMKIPKLLFPRYLLQIIAFTMVVMELFPTRQGLTFALFIFGYYYAQKGNLVKYIIIVALCYCIHRSSVLLIPLYFILRLKCSFILYSVVYVLTYGASEFFYSVFDGLQNISILSVVTDGMLEQYNANHEGFQNFQGESDATSSLISAISGYVQFSLFYFCNKKNENVEDDGNVTFQRIALNGYFIMILLYIVGRLPGFGTVFRVAYYFHISYIICVIFLVKYLYEHSKQLIAIGVFVLLFMIKYKGAPFFLENSFIYIPYECVFNDDNINRAGKW